MSNMFKNLDNSFIKSIMQAQGINMTDEQLNFMKSNMNPQMMKMAANTNVNSNFIPSNLNSSTSTSTVNNRQNETINSNGNQSSKDSSFSGGIPDMANIDMSKMMEMIQKNPQMMNMIGSQMNSMFRGGHNGNLDIDPNIMMNSMQTIFWIMSVPTRIKNFLLSFRGMLLFVLIIAIITAYLKN